MASEQVLSLRAVNRALLARQLLLDRPRLPAAGPGRTAQVVQTIEMFGPVRRLGTARRDALAAEAERVLAFAAPGAAHEIRFVPLAGKS